MSTDLNTRHEAGHAAHTPVPAQWSIPCRAGRSCAPGGASMTTPGREWADYAIPAPRAATG
ncbi:hypothetical protein [Pseudonocardia yunnanensis]|uniref:Uncharacterized protein n=1 Tax=Pseudonocardia yunnanensis TaxID=58107 RepID=A0ABW4FCT7_9PSEU